MKFKPKQTVHVRRFASSNQCNGPDLLENMIVKLRSVYVQLLVDFDPRPLRLQSVYSSYYFD